MRLRAVAMVVIAVVVGVLALAGGSPSAHPTSAAPDLSRCVDPAAAEARLLPTTPDGPAKGAITGTAVTRSFSLSHGFLTAAPPPHGYVPRITAAKAGCQLSSGYGPRGDGVSPGRLALATVSVRSPVDRGYHRRVAWMLVSAAQDTAASCPAGGAPVSATPSRATLEIFLIDAATGSDGVVFEEGYTLCGRYVKPPTAESTEQTVSVPWTLVSRTPDGLTATITASWPPCERPAGGSDIRTDRDLRTVTVAVFRPFGPDCGDAVAHTIRVQSDLIGRPMAAALVHGPVGVVTSR